MPVRTVGCFKTTICPLGVSLFEGSAPFFRSIQRETKRNSTPFWGVPKTMHTHPLREGCVFHSEGNLHGDTDLVTGTPRDVLAGQVVHIKVGVLLSEDSLNPSWSLFFLRFAF